MRSKKPKRDVAPRPARTKATIEEELACVLAILDGMTDKEIEAAQARGIPYGERKLLTADQIRSTWQFDHNIQHAIGGPAKHWNFTPRRILAHRDKTHRIDRPQIRKTDRIGEAQVEFQRKMLAKAGHDAGEPEPRRTKAKGKIPSRPFQKPAAGAGRKLQGRKFETRKGKV